MLLSYVCLEAVPLLHVYVISGETKGEDKREIMEDKRRTLRQRMMAENNETRGEIMGWKGKRREDNEFNGECMLTEKWKLTERNKEYGIMEENDVAWKFNDQINGHWMGADIMGENRSW